eukprot:1138528-Pelagomonas_calceolata.AAC.2
MGLNSGGSSCANAHGWLKSILHKGFSQIAWSVKKRSKGAEVGVAQVILSRMGGCRQRACTSP